MGEPCWQIADDYRYLEEADRAGFAWEFLRRNADYRTAAARRISPATEYRGGIEILTGAPSALRWGLHFRGKSPPPGG